MSASTGHGVQVPLADVALEARRVVELARSRDLLLRVLGGVGVRLRAARVAPAFEREHNDIDFAASRGASREVTSLFLGAGYRADVRFNSLYSHDRLRFLDDGNTRHADVFVGNFRMSHNVALAERLEVDEVTLPLAELLLTKLQIAEINEKDVTDVCLLLDSHAVGSDDACVNADQIGRACAADWGLWRTVTRNLELCLAHLERSDVETESHNRIQRRIADLRNEIARRSKASRWKLRAMIGDRKRWYALPREVGA